jgi:ElaB/YqjD/DUF883 family membrane-anchored ribosome-binding protein
MSDEPEVIKQQMEETRTAMAEKLKTLEHQVVETVAEANTAVTETVESVKEAVHDTVETVKDSFEETVESVKNALDLSQQWDRHPWVLMGGAVALGYLGGCFLSPSRSTRRREEREGQRFVSSRARPAEGATFGNGSHDSEARTSGPAEQPSSGWLSTLGETFSAEIGKLKGLAVGSSMGLVRDLIVQAAPDQLRPQVTELLNSLTTKLGGEPIEGPLIEPSPENAQGQDACPSPYHLTETAGRRATAGAGI